ncbi:MAG: aldo/keto reductase [Bacteroidota bacterium]
MKYNELGKTGVLVSELCLGTMTFGGKGFWTAIGQVPQEEVNQIVKTAVEKGINFIDTANGYSEGLSETMLGIALKALSIPRQEVFVATKVRIRMGAGNSRRDAFDFPPINKAKAYDLIDLMAEIGKKHNVTVANVALNWVIRQPGMTSTIIGAKNLLQLNDNISAVKLQMTPEEIQQLNDASALAPEYPGWMVARQAQGRWPD